MIFPSSPIRAKTSTPSPSQVRSWPEKGEFAGYMSLGAEDGLGFRTRHSVFESGEVCLGHQRRVRPREDEQNDTRDDYQDNNPSDGDPKQPDPVRSLLLVVESAFLHLVGIVEFIPHHRILRDERRNPTGPYRPSTVTAITTGAVLSGPFTNSISLIIASRFGVTVR